MGKRKFDPKTPKNVDTKIGFNDYVSISDLYNRANFRGNRPKGVCSRNS